MFLFIPLIPLFGSKKKLKKCPLCGRTFGGDKFFCPYDGEELEDI